MQNKKQELNQVKQRVEARKAYLEQLAQFESSHKLVYSKEKQGYEVYTPEPPQEEVPVQAQEQAQESLEN